MTIDRAIKHLKEVAEENRKQEALENQCELFWNAQKCRRCAEEHEQIAEWLEELKELRQEEYDNTQFQLMAYADGYDKALDDVFDALLDSTKPTGKYIDSKIIVKVLEQLRKRGGQDYEKGVY